MSPTVFSLQKKLKYPLYGADFHPLNQDFLLVGGGGGSSSTGVPNKISLLDTSRRTELTEVVDIELASQEDAVTNIGVADADESFLTAFAGINSSAADLSVGKNEHLRSFRIALPSKTRSADGGAKEADEKAPVEAKGTEALGRVVMFKPVKPAKGTKLETYQRVLRLSPVHGASEPRLAAVASGLAPENEIVVFRPVSRPGPSDEISRISLGKSEAADLDITPVDQDKDCHTLAYCTDDEVFLQKLPSKSASAKPDAPTSLYQTPEISTLPPGKRPKFRCLRFLTPRHILLLQNKPGRTGADLLVLRVSKDGTLGQIVLRKRLHKSIKLATGLDVAALSTNPAGERQLVIAVASQNCSIEVLTIDFAPSSGLASFKPYTLLREVHSQPLTRLCFSTLLQPSLPVSGNTPPQSIRLASVGVDMTVVVHYLPLRPYPSHSSKNPRYVLTPPGSSEAVQTTFSLVFALLVVGLAAFLMQCFCEIRGAVPPIIGATDWLSPGVRDMIARPYIYADGRDLKGAVESAASAATSGIPSVDDVKVQFSGGADGLLSSLEELVNQNSELDTPKAIILRDEGDEVSAALAHDVDVVKEEALKKWDDLTEKEKKSWKAKLEDAGHWVEGQGEGILKGILFSQLAEAVGRAVAGG